MFSLSHTWVLANMDFLGLFFDLTGLLDPCAQPQYSAKFAKETIVPFVQSLQELQLMSKLSQHNHGSRR